MQWQALVGHIDGCKCIDTIDAMKEWSHNLQCAMNVLPDTKNCGLRMHRECRERFSSHRELAIPTCITARAWRYCQLLLFYLKSTKWNTISIALFMLTFQYLKNKFVE